MIFETRKQLHEYTGLSYKANNHLWRELWLGKITDDDVLTILAVTNILLRGDK